MKKGKKKAGKSKVNKILPVIAKLKGKFVYIKQTIERKFKNNKKAKHQDQDHYINVSRVIEVKQSQLLTKYRSQIFTTSEPFLILEAEQPQFSMPQYLQVTIHKGKRIDYSDEVEYWRVPAIQFFEHLSKPKTKSQSMNFSVPQMKLENGQYNIPRIVQRYLKKIEKVNIWMYCGDRQTDWHYDGHDNFLYVLEGQKIVYLAEPQAIIAKNTFSLFNNHCGQQVDRVNLRVYKATVGEGKCLFIPKGWWHTVYSYGNPSFALNYWGNSINQTITNLTSSQKNLVLKSLLFSITDEFCQNKIPEWDKMSQQQKQSFRTLAGHKLIDYSRL